jgi:nucleoside-diphosphate-sugar epimerase
VKYLVTGATGFLGGAIARQLIAAGHQLVVLARTPAKAAPLAALGAAVVPGDITDRASLRAAMAGVDGLFHCAALYQWGADPERIARINVDGTRHVLEVMRELGVAKGVYTSTLAVNSDTHGREVDEAYRYEGPFLSAYERTKWRAHYEVARPLMAAGLPLVILQPGAIYGPGDTSTLRGFFRQYLERRLPLVPPGTAFGWGHIDDVAAAHLSAMTRGRAGESYIVSGPSHTMEDALHIAHRLTGIPPPTRRPPPIVLKAAAALLRVAGPLVRLPEGMSAESLRLLAGVTYLGVWAKAGRELGFAPRSLEDGLRDTLAKEILDLGLDVNVSSRRHE